MTTEIGIYVCLTKGCEQRDKEVQHDWCADWPLDKRQKKCKSCKKRMVLYAIKKSMTDEAKQKLRDLAAKRKEKLVKGRDQ